MNNYYTYVLINSLDNMPIYVGKGKKNRAECHFKAIKNHKHYNVYLQRKVLKIWENDGEVIVKKLFMINEQTAFNREVLFIKFLKYTGIKLCNMTDGGEGVSGYIYSKEQNKKNSERKLGCVSPNKGKKLTKEWIDNLKKNHADFSGSNNPFYGKYHTEQSNKINSDKHKGKISTRKGKTYEEIYGLEKTNNLKKKQSLSLKGKIPWNKGKIGVQVAWNKNIPCAEESKNKISESLKRYYATREVS
jgi:hypothetical protein